jgi:hypothetical protein
MSNIVQDAAILLYLCALTEVEAAAAVSYTAV